jgi:hypothetical protein
MPLPRAAACGARGFAQTICRKKNIEIFFEYRYITPQPHDVDPITSSGV